MAKQSYSRFQTLVCPALKLTFYSLLTEKEVATNQCLLKAALHYFFKFCFISYSKCKYPSLVFNKILFFECYSLVHGKRTIDGLCVLILILLQVCLGVSQTVLLGVPSLMREYVPPSHLLYVLANVITRAILASLGQFCLFKILLSVYKTIFLWSCSTIPQKTTNPIKAGLQQPPLIKDVSQISSPYLYTRPLNCFLIHVASNISVLTNAFTPPLWPDSPPDDTQPWMSSPLVRLPSAAQDRHTQFLLSLGLHLYTGFLWQNPF